MKIRFTATAIDEVDEILSYIAQHAAGPHIVLQVAIGRMQRARNAAVL